METLASQMGEVILSDRMAKRPDFGKAGKQIPIRANVYPLKVKSGVNITQYDVVVSSLSKPPKKEAAEPPRLPVARARAVVAQLIQANPNISPLKSSAFDGNKNLFTVDELPGGSGPFDFQVTVDAGTSGAEEFKVTLTHAQTLGLDVLTTFFQQKCKTEAEKQSSLFAVACLDILFRQTPATRQGWIVSAQGRKFLDTTKAENLGQGAQVLQGFFQSCRPTMAGMVMNVDSAYSPVWRSGALLEVCKAIVGKDASGGGGGSFRGGGRGGPRGRGGDRGGRGGRGGSFSGGGAPPPFTGFDAKEVKYLEMKLKGANVRVTHRPEARAYKLQGFGRSANQQQITIDKKEGGGPTPAQRASAAALGKKLPPETKKQETLTVAQYFGRTYPNARLDPSLPVVKLGRTQYVPMDVVELVAGSVIPPTKLTGDQAANQIRVTAKKPAERQKQISDVRRDEKYESNTFAKAWGVEVSNEMLKLQGRVLTPPKVQYAPKSKIAAPRVNEGSWNLKDTRFISACPPLERWGILSFDRRPVTDFINALVLQGRQRGINVSNTNPEVVQCQSYSEADTLQGLKAIGKKIIEKTKKGPQIIIIVLTDQKKYPQLKRQASFDLPVFVPTQVVLAKNIFKDRGLDQYCGNLWMKMNLKLLSDGNWAVAEVDTPFLNKEAILMGADVTHSPGGRGDERAPSIAALCSTINSNNRVCAAEVREQQGGTEMIANLQEMVKKRMNVWIKESKNAKPERIIFFRDGVSEGQLNTVLEAEIPAIKAACRDINPNYNPKLTYVVCAKRHHFRFFAERESDTDRTGNLPPGLCVDTSVVHPYLFDFFVQAQQGLQGTAKPTRYIVLLDEIGFKADQIQKLANSLCFSFSRATRSVSLVPVCYYADIVCEKARSLARLDDSSDLGSVASGATGRTELQPSAIQQKLERSQNLPPMWYI